MVAPSAKSSGQSKTARASMPSAGGAKANPYVAAATSDINRLIPLAGGEFVYLLDPKDGRTLHLGTRSEAFVAKVAELSANGLAPRLNAELKTLAAAHPGGRWAKTKAFLAEAGALGEAAA